MNDNIINESGMSFHIEDKNTYQIEKSRFVTSLNGYHKVDFVTLSPDKRFIVLVEAKQSLAQNNSTELNHNLDEIMKKFHDTIEIINAINIRHNDRLEDELGGLASCNFSRVDYACYLVVKNRTDDSLPHLSDMLKSKLTPFFKCWNIHDRCIKVFNEEKARKKGIIA